MTTTAGIMQGGALEEYRRAHVPLYNEQRFKLGLFGINTSGGVTMSSAETTFRLAWEHNAEIARRADALGFEMLLSAGRWKSIAGTSDFNRASFDTYAWAAGVAAVTERLMPITTTHLFTIHPVLAAKQAATIDHISGGRYGMNLVMGWNTPEIEMFGSPVREHDDRYQFGSEWVEIVKRLWTEPEPFDYKGRYFEVPQAESLPKPVQRPHPVMVNAGNSPAGIDFSARFMDFNFMAVASRDQAADQAKAIRTLARDEYGRELGLLTYVYVICRDTEAEAHRVRDDIVAKGDRDAVFNVVSIYDPAGAAGGLADQVRSSQEAQNAFILGSGSFPIIGTPDQVVDAFAGLADAGLDGAVMILLDYNEEMKYFDEAVMPLLRQVGLRK